MTKNNKCKDKWSCPTCGCKKIKYAFFSLFGILGACTRCEQLVRVVQ